MTHDHVSAERLQAFLDGELPERDASRIEEHLAGCARCASEADAWRVLIEDLGALPAHRPGPGFAARVMADVRTPARAPLAVPAHGREARGGHVPGEVLQDYLDGALGRRRGARIEGHLAACGDCSSEAEEWAGVIDRLGRLERFAPSPAFRASVMAGVAIPESRSLAARIREGLGSLLAPSPHPDAGRLQDYVEGLLPARVVGRIDAHVHTCPGCAGELDGWRALAARLGSLERFEPSGGFADRVMSSVRVPERAAAAVPAPARAAPAFPAPRLVWARALAVARRLVPQTRQAWAAISGMAVTPAVIAGLVLYAVFSHPTLTPSALASFVWWQVGDLAAAAWGFVSEGLLQSAQVFGLYSVFEALVAAPFAVAGGVLLYSVVSALALRVLYKNVIANRPLEGRYVRASAS